MQTTATSYCTKTSLSPPLQSEVANTECRRKLAPQKAQKVEYELITIAAQPALYPANVKDNLFKNLHHLNPPVRKLTPTSPSFQPICPTQKQPLSHNHNIRSDFNLQSSQKTSLTPLQTNLSTLLDRSTNIRRMW